MVRSLSVSCSDAQFIAYIVNSKPQTPISQNEQDKSHSLPISTNHNKYHILYSLSGPPFPLSILDTITMSSLTADTPKITLRDAVRREALKYFSCNPGIDNCGPNGSVHSRARQCLSDKEVTDKVLTDTALRLFYRNTLNSIALECIRVLEIKPLWSYYRFDPVDRDIYNKVSYSREIRLSASQMLQDMGILPRPRGFEGQFFYKPIDFVAWTLLCSGYTPGHGYEEKAQLLHHPVIEEKLAKLKAVRAEVLKHRHDDEPSLHTLALCCDLDSEFEYEKGYLNGYLIYRNDTNAAAYDLLKALDMKLICLWEKFGKEEERYLGEKSAKPYLNLVDEYLADRDDLSERNRRYIAICGRWNFRRPEEFAERLASVVGPARQDSATAKDGEVGELDQLQNKP